MTSCRTWNIVCSVVRRDLGKPGFFTRNMPASAPQQQQPGEDVDLDEVLHYLPDLTLLVEKKRKVLGWETSGSGGLAVRR